MKADHARAKGLCCGVLALSVLYDVSRTPEMVEQFEKVLDSFRFTKP
ncbi:hypothetical protein ACE3MS_16015 [Paenibacillus dendritiformis]